jgi:hypothetical protein
LVVVLSGQDNSPGHFSGNAVKYPEKPGEFPEKTTNLRAQKKVATPQGIGQSSEKQQEQNDNIPL